MPTVHRSIERYIDLSELPGNAMFFLGFLVPRIFRRMKISAGGRQRFMAQSVAHVTQIHTVVGHVGARGMP